MMIKTLKNYKYFLCLPGDYMMYLETALVHWNLFLAPLHHLCAPVFPQTNEIDCILAILLLLICNFLTIPKP